MKSLLTKRKGYYFSNLDWIKEEEEKTSNHMDQRLSYDFYAIMQNFVAFFWKTTSYYNKDHDCLIMNT